MSITNKSILLAAMGLGTLIGRVNAQSLPPVETQKANSEYKPAFTGQTRIGGIQTKTKLNVTIINHQLKSPWALRCLPDGRFLITEKGGTMRILKADGSFDKNIEGLPAIAVGGQGGLLDVNFDSSFAKDRTLFWTYSEQVEGGFQLAVAKGKLSADDSKLENVQVIYHAKPAYNGHLQFGSRVVFDKQGNLFVSTGEHGAEDIRMKAQDLGAAVGKVVHITRDGKAVPGGPFAGKSGILPEIYAYGLRNPEGMTTNPVTGELWEAEFGPRGGDEINIIRAGKNYGWPVVTYGIEYSGQKVGDGIQQKEGVTQPIYYWDPSISPCGITFYTGNLIPEWKNNLFVGALGGSHIARLVIKNNKVVAEERLLKDKNERWRSLVTGKDGALYGVTDNGNLYRIGK
ncbi:PQQ-dependent sugar dehydrogenase [Mucilaginibacter endophyticus]|uniref:PQQ-dependent sugar dehydrogenase n=1 Tax=Mucilaginibacter endophyticus TaxID=2675003 RepID=UPI000E0CE600|nr:PQQ-dependent sugar dehydrogenase [Mucilaginibacter endophyticus]